MRNPSPATLTIPGFAVLLAGVSLLAAGCGGESDIRDLGTRAVVIGIDSADWRIIDPMIAAGELPHLAGLVEQGVRGPIQTLNDISLSPVIWTSVVTGKTAVKHGISWFMVDRPDGTRVPVRSHNRKVKALWNILAERKRRPVAIGWWASYPAEEVGKGIIISDGLGVHGFGRTARQDSDEGKTYPKELFAEVDALIPPEQQISTEFAQRFIHLSADEYRHEMFDPARFPKHDPTNPIHLFQQYAVTAQGYTAIAQKLLAEPFDLLLLYYEQVDSFSHLFMKFAPPKLDWIGEAEFARYQDVVHEWYRYQDELLGRLFEQIDLETTALFIVSDHGFKSGERRIRSEEAVDIGRAHLDHEPDGIFLAVGPHLRRAGRVEGASVLDLTPTLLHYLGFPVAKDMDGKVLEGIFLPGFMRDNPIRYIGTYEDDEPAEAAASEVEELSAGELAETERRLETLGYLGDSSSGRGGTGSMADTSGAGSDGAPSVDTVSAGGDGAGDRTEEQSSPEIHNNLARIHLRNGEIEEARREFQAALRLAPSNADSLLGLSTLLQLEGRTAEAEQMVERALQGNPNSVAALAQLAEIRRDEGNLTEAVRLFEEALAIDDSLPFLFQGYGDVLQRAGRYADAEEAFKMVLQLEPDSFKARYNLGVTYSNQHRTDDAIAQYEAALEANPDDPEATKALNNLGAIYLDRGDTEQAAEKFEAAVASGPFHLEAHYNLALIRLDQGRLEEAVALLERAAQISPNHEVVTTRLAWAYLDAGRGEDAYRSFLLVQRLYPQNWSAALGLAVLHAASGQPEPAREQLDRALALGGDAARNQAADFPALADYL